MSSYSRRMSDYRFASDLIVELHNIVLDVLHQQLIKMVLEKHPEWRHIPSVQFEANAFGMISNGLVSTHPKTAGMPYSLRGKSKSIYEMDISATTNVLLFSNLANLHEKEKEAIHTIRKDRNDDAHSLKNTDYYKLLGFFSNAISLAREFGYTIEAKRLEEMTHELHNRIHFSKNNAASGLTTGSKEEKKSNALVAGLLTVAILLLLGLFVYLIIFIQGSGTRPVDGPGEDQGGPTEEATQTFTIQVLNRFADEVPRYIENDVSINPKNVWHDNGELLAEMFLTNGYSDRAIIGIDAEWLVLSNYEAVIAEGYVGLIDDIVIEPKSYIVVGFRFSGNELKLENAMLRDLEATWTRAFTTDSR